MRFPTTGSILALSLAAPVFGYPRTGVEKRLAGDPQRAGAVRDTFRISWKGYYEHAFPNDNLHPVSNGNDNDRNGWGATAIDGLSTAIIMGEAATVNQILKFVPSINFNTTKSANDGVSVFETTIRYLGGLLAGYDLLTGPFAYLDIDHSLVKNLLTQAVNLAESLKVSFDTPSGIPDPTVYLNPTKRNSGSSNNNIAEIGTLVLEWTRLSDLTHNPLYAQLAQKGENHLLQPKGQPEAFPGLIGTFVSTKDGTFLDSSGGWSAYDDSYFEYLIKMYLYDPKAFKLYKDRWVLAADSTIKYLASHPTTRKDLTFLSSYNGKQTNPNSGHLASFAGGNFILGGILLGEQKYIDFGLNLAESYFETYKQSLVGIGPEGFRWVDAALPQGGNNPAPPANQADFYKKAGFWTTSGGYILRPETMESLYYSYRVTGDKKYQDMAWEGYLAINKTCRAGSAYSSINDVTKPNGGGFSDNMQSFWLAEALKYMYLIFADESPVQVQARGGNTFVFNTEAHPFRIRQV
ncbi:Mannosyl-oligosaccharide alpha-1,2-mannosidase [Cladobotryum mycophilum]|uniref:alpha-1,2-Mannosidase n=1 Tax=Cladobotryum mycophilum TaxID=491253 RepID=A0ABR0S7H4_9HYPO